MKGGKGGDLALISTLQFCTLYFSTQNRKGVFNQNLLLLPNFSPSNFPLFGKSSYGKGFKWRR
ncbi:MAG: hypothetical protein C6I01_03565 [Epsilonproteobacteria bacterium]|nr:hypothetical protein [Campylobacterota bacterium]